MLLHHRFCTSAGGARCSRPTSRVFPPKRVSLLKRGRGRPRPGWEHRRPFPASPPGGQVRERLGSAAAHGVFRQPSSAKSMGLAPAERPLLYVAVAHLVLSVVLMLPHFPRSHRGCRCTPTLFLASLAGHWRALGNGRRCARGGHGARHLTHPSASVCGHDGWCIALRPRRPVSMRSALC